MTDPFNFQRFVDAQSAVYSRVVNELRAILDVNIDGKLIAPVAKLVAARGLPILFASGYGALGLPAELPGHAALTKPSGVHTARLRVF